MIFPIHYIRISFLRFLRMQIGKYTAICRGVDIRTPYRISIGSYTTINKHVVLDGRGGIVIGNCVDIAQDVNIYGLCNMIIIALLMRRKVVRLLLKIMYGSLLA